MAAFCDPVDGGELFHYSLNPEDITCVDMEADEKRTFLSVLFSEKRIGACFYREDNGRLLLFADCEESSPNFETLEMLITQIEPTFLLLNQNCNEAFKAKAKAMMSDYETPAAEVMYAGGRDAQPVPSTSAATSSTSVQKEDTDSVFSCDSRSNILLIADKYFSEKFSKDQMMSLNVPVNASHTDKERFIFLSSIINVTNTNLMRSIGALIKFLDVLSQKTGDTFPIAGLQNFFPQQRVYVDNTTIEALQVFKTDWHPSSYKFGSGKDGFCVFSKYNRCVTLVGKAFMRKIFQHPLTDLATLNERFDILSLFSAPENSEKIALIKLNLKYVFSMHRIVKRMTVGHALIKDWKALHRTLMSSITIFELIRCAPEMVANSSLLRRYLQSFNGDVITKLSTLITATINFRESTKDDLFRVKRGVSETIDSKIALYRSLPDILNREFINDIPALSEVADDAALIYMPQIGFVVKVKMQAEAQNYIEGFQFKFLNDGWAFFKSPTCVKLDDEIGDIELNIRDEEVTIMYELQDEVLRCAQEIYDTIDKLAAIDCFIAMSEVSAENNYIRPTFNDRNEFNIVGGRHYLQESCVDRFVANDFVSGRNNEESKVKIITGANACGKSIYLKQICLISYMAQIGCFVPAESASLPVVDKIFTRIQTVESVSTKVSSFCFDLNQVSIAMRNATSRSVVGLDEFGKGTSISQGASLLSAIINYWVRGADTPHLLVLTHLLSLPKLLKKSPKIEFKTFEVVVEEDKVIYAYKLKGGIAESSLGVAVVRSIGFPQHIVNRAKHISETLAAGSQLTPLKNNKYDNYVSKCIEVGKAYRNLNLRESNDPEQVIKIFLESLKQNSDQ